MQQKCVSPDFRDLRIFITPKERTHLWNTTHNFWRPSPSGGSCTATPSPASSPCWWGALYNIVDQIFIANASYLGSYGNAANTVVFPLTVVALAIAVMIGDGCCTFVSISLGKGQREDARRAVGNAVVLAAGSGLVLTALYLLLADQILAMFGGTVNAETFRYSQEYFFYISLGIPFYMFGQAMNPVIRAGGAPRFAMISTLAGAVVNILLDPIFIFVCRWGMMGAAVATVIGQVITAGLAVWYLPRMKVIRPGRRDLRSMAGSAPGCWHRASPASSPRSVWWPPWPPSTIKQDSSLPLMGGGEPLLL